MIGVAHPDHHLIIMRLIPSEGNGIHDEPLIRRMYVCMVIGGERKSRVSLLRGVPGGVRAYSRLGSCVGDFLLFTQGVQAPSDSQSSDYCRTVVYNPWRDCSASLRP